MDDSVCWAETDILILMLCVWKTDASEAFDALTVRS